MYIFGNKDRYAFRVSISDKINVIVICTKAASAKKHFQLFIKLRKKQRKAVTKNQKV